MKRVYIQVVDPVHKTSEQASLKVNDRNPLDEACLHLGFDSNIVIWTESVSIPDPVPTMPDHRVLIGYVEKTSRLITYIEYSE